MEIKKGGIDFVEKILNTCYEYNKFDVFVMSLMHQYEDRGFLTKAQLQGLYYKVENNKEIAPGLVATLKATIAKLPTKAKKNEIIEIKEIKKDEETETILKEILLKYPQHKAILTLQNNFNKFSKLNSTEKLELNRLYKILIKK